MDQFKKYMREHRDELDLEKPPAFDTWPNTSRRMDYFSRPVIKWLAAASVICLVSIILFWFVKDSPKNLPNAVATASKDSVLNSAHDLDLARTDSLADVKVNTDTAGHKLNAQTPALKPSGEKNTAKVHRKAKQPEPPLRSIETNYVTIINYQLRRLESTPIYAESADYFHVFKKQWYDLGKDEEKLKKDIEVYGLNDILVDQFIQLYQNKISVLKQLQTEINKMNQRARNHPEVQKQTPSYLKM